MPLEKRLGFGCMRLPVKNREIDMETLCRMVDTFLAAGFCYFDTARGYMRGRSENAVRQCLTARYPRARYLLADKLSAQYFSSQEEVRPLFESQLSACGVSYFDYYLMHAQDRNSFPHFQRCRAYETALALKEEGKIRHFGISFHDKARTLEEILRAYPQIEVVQIQLNYVDYEDPSVESRACYEVCRAYEKTVLVMEPVKGGSLARLPDAARKTLDGLGGGSPASYALRFAAGLEGVATVLSGMSDLQMLEENIQTMKTFRPLDGRERAALEEVCQALRAQRLINCTACRYCEQSCPRQIAIPDLFACMNAKKLFKNWNTDYYYRNVYTMSGGRASDCIRCGQCERLCPQHLPIRALLQEVARTFERK